MLSKVEEISIDYISAIVNGDRKTLEVIYQKFFPIARKITQAYSHSEEEAQDLFQEAILLIYYKAQAPGFTLTSQFSTYFYGVCRNLWGNRIQKREFQNVTVDPAVKYNSEERIEGLDAYAEKRMLFDRAFKKLKPKCQELLRLFFDKIPMQTIAEKMGFKSEGYARRRKHQCKEHLVELVKLEPEYEELSEFD